jgi:hypothetical protein
MVLELQLNDKLAQEAKASGLLESAAIEDMLRSELKRRRIDKLFAAADRLSSAQLPPMSEAEIEAEIAASRAPKRSSDARSR